LAAIAHPRERDPGRHSVSQAEVICCGHAIDENPDLIAPRHRVDDAAWV
jgi:hypothetical protein